MSIRYLPPLKNIAKEVVGGWWRWPQDNLIALDNYGLHIPISQNPSSLNSEKDSTFQQSSFILGCMAPQGAKISRIEKLRAPWEEFQYEISFRELPLPHKTTLIEVNKESRTTHPISINSEGIQFENADKNISNTKNQNKNLKDEKSKIQIQDFETERKWFTKDHRLAYPYFYGVLPSGKSILEMCVWGAAEMKFLAYVWTNQPVSLYSLSSDDM
ncbi:MAG: hypothetical protein EZS28_018056 [Streblomastix strix]|uniref:Uncharacterized protein n=1 Tax=Streblomastix strix TaxID=222440 RepID=A0A5J4VW61_9EUKA|nr:MAG: hypothetical protein EZS28_018056 [Streblomastix strix]